MYRNIIFALRLAFRSDPRALITHAVSVFVASFLPVLGTYALKMIIDQTQHGDGSGPWSVRLLSLIALLFCISVLSALSQATSSGVAEVLALKIEYEVRRGVFEKVNMMTASAFENSAVYDQLHRALREADTRPFRIYSEAISLVFAVFSSLLLIVILFRMMSWAFIMVVIFNLPSALIIFRFGIQSYHVERLKTQDFRRQIYIEQILSSDTLVKELRVFGAQNWLFNLWTLSQRATLSFIARAIRKKTVWSGIGHTISSSFVPLLLAYLILAKDRSPKLIGDIALIVVGLPQLQSLLMKVISSIGAIFRDVLYINDLRGFLEDRDPPPCVSEELMTIDSIEFRDVSFRYPNSNAPLLDGISFTLNRGEIIALIGRNGAGKSTLVKLLLGFYTPDCGLIYVNGRDLSLFDGESYRQKTSVLFQDFGKFSLKAEENITLGNYKDVDDTLRIRKAITQSQAFYLDTLPNGLQTQLGTTFQNGHQLSGGEWQRLALARAQFRRAELRIYDEPTSALDAVAESNLLNALRREGGQSITVIITHRLSSAVLADKIIVMKDGRIVELGTHSELIKFNGTYAEMFHIQAAAFGISNMTEGME